MTVFLNFIYRVISLQCQVEIGQMNIEEPPHGKLLLNLVST